MLKRILISVFFILLFATPVSGAGPLGNGVDDLRGRWDVYLHIGDEYEGEDLEVRWLIQDIEAHPEEENTFLAAGCMKTIESKKYAPLSMVASYILGENKYDLLIYSTIIPVEGEPFVIRFDGEVFVHGSGVKDDESQGDHISDRGEGLWEAEHHDRRRPHCGEMIDPSLQFNQDLYAHQDLAPPTPHYYKLYEAYTRIVSSGMLVDTPDGQTVFVPTYTDIFSPFVDFVSEFRYLLQLEGPPIIGEIYTFTLLDILGNPIPGAIAEDIWTGCTQGAPRNITLTYNTGEDLMMEWDPVPIAEGWDPGGDPQVGYYQIGISPTFESQTSYGSAGIASPKHFIPWSSFIEGEDGSPDGTDFGVSLSELDDGEYDVSLEGFAEAPSLSGGVGAECSVRDSNELFHMYKSGSELSFIGLGSIAGQVTNEVDDPLPRVWVDACEYNDEPQYCRSSQTDEHGIYYIYGLLPGDYRVQAGNESYAREFFDDTYEWPEATPVTVAVGATTPDIDFQLSQAGSISGTVYDEGDVPLSNIAVDIEQGGFGTCTNENGKYTMSGVPLGTYTVVAGRDFCDPHNYLEERIENVELTEATPNVGGVDFNLLLGGSISGTVTDTDEIAIEGIHVEACEFSDDPQFCRGAETDANGDYLITGLPPIVYRVWAGGPGWVTIFYNDKLFHHEADEVAVVAGDVTSEIDFVLVQGGSISGTVYDESGINPLSNIAVDIEQGGYGACTDEYGNYNMSGIPLGTYTVVAGRDFCGPHDYIEGRVEEVELTDGAPHVLGVDFNLVLGGSISGTVKDILLNPMVGIQVVACEYDGGFCMDSFSDAEGNYMITGLPESEYRVQSGSEWYVTEFFNETYDWSLATRVGVVAGWTTGGINFTLEEGGSIAGMVTDDGDNPIEGVIVIACEIGGYCMDATSESDGTYRIYAIPASDYRVEAHGEGFVIFFPGTVDPDSAEWVTVVANVITEGIDFTLTPE